jgi:serine/threonine-protein kinase
MQPQLFLDKYRVVRLLAEGGMSNVYLARDVAGNRDVVVKVLKEELLKSTTAVEHFRREVHILRRFRHPNVVAVIDAAPRHPQGPVLVLEYVRGTDLGLLLQRDGRLSAERTGHLLVQLCGALQAVHDAGIVHRDLKPGNLLILFAGTPYESIKLMDFGLAKMSSLLYISEEELGDYAPPTTAGTPHYLPPEQVRGYDSEPRGDVYSVGVMLYEMLAGRRPFLHEDTKAILEAHVKETVPFFDEVLGADHGVPGAVEAVVRRCLAKSPDQRPASAAALAAEYSRALGQRLGPLSERRPVPAHLTDTSASNAPPGGATQRQAPIATAADRHAIRHCFDVTMPQAMAMLKVKGFIYDLGGRVIDNEPGRIRVRIGGTTPQPEKRWGWSSSGQPAAAPQQPLTDLEVQLDRRGTDSPNDLTIKLVMRPPGGVVRPEWRTRCQELARDLAAYLMGR